MKRVLGATLGTLLILVGVIALFGAIEVVRGGGTLEAVAQGFLVPATLFVIGGFALYMSITGRKNGGD